RAPAGDHGPQAAARGDVPPDDAGHLTSSRQPGHPRTVRVTERAAMPKDLQTYLVELSERRPDDLLAVSREVDPVFELTGVVARLEQERRFPAVLFRRVKGSHLPVLINLNATYERLALALGTTVQEMVPEFARRYANPLPVREVADGPVKEVVWTGDQVNLEKLPFTVHNELDAGKYVSAGVLLLGGPASSVR